MRHLIILGIAFLLSHTAYAGGSIDQDDRSKLYAQQTKAWAALNQAFEIENVGWATRIGSRVSPNLGGARIGPYHFYARPKGTSVPPADENGIPRFPFVLKIMTETRFLNDAGQEVDLSEATQIEEKLVGFMLVEAGKQ